MAGLVTRVAPASVGAVKDARSVLAAGGLVAFPTETVYGLGADATNDKAVAKLYAVKERPSFNPLIAHVADLAAATRLAVFDDAALHLARAFWPGPLTLVLPKAAHCPVGLLATAGLDTIAVRVPSHPVAREILAAFAKPVVAPSANRSGKVSPTTAQHVLHDLRDRIDLLVNDGPAPLGIESTIVACLDGPVLLRPGAIDRDAIEKVLGVAVAAPARTARRRAGKARPSRRAAPLGAGHARLPLRAADAAAHQRQGGRAGRGPARVRCRRCHPARKRPRRRSTCRRAATSSKPPPTCFPTCAASTPRRPTAIAVVPIPDRGIGEAINDRLRHAAAPREPAPMRLVSPACE